MNMTFRVVHPDFSFHGGPSNITLKQGEPIRTEFERDGENTKATSLTKPAMIVAHYEDVEGACWESTLEVSHDLIPGRLRVALPCEQHAEEQANDS